MATAVAPNAALPTQTDPMLLKAILDSVSNALIMCNASARCVAVSSVPTRDQGLITGMIGIHGKVSGFITVNLSEKFAIRAVEGLLQDSYGTLSSQVIDGAGEITNIIVGGIKSTLANSQWGFSHITVPSVIVGTGYQIAYSRGLEFLCVTFEHQNEDFLMLSDRLLQVSVSMLKL